MITAGRGACRVAAQGCLGIHSGRGRIASWGSVCRCGAHGRRGIGAVLSRHAGKGEAQGSYGGQGRQLIFLACGVHTLYCIAYPQKLPLGLRGFAAAVRGPASSSYISCLDGRPVTAEWKLWLAADL